MNSSPAPSGSESAWTNDGGHWSQALSRMEAALRLLDESDGPPHVGAQLDLAIQQLRDEIAQSRSD